MQLSELCCVLHLTKILRFAVCQRVLRPWGYKNDYTLVPNVKKFIV